MTAPASPRPDGPASPRRRPRWLARGAFALLFVGLPLLGMAALAVLWARSYRVEDTAEVARGVEDFDPGSRIDRTSRGELRVVTTAGILSVEAMWWAEARTITDPDEAEEIRQDYERHRVQPDPEDWVGWHWQHWAEERPPDTSAQRGGILERLDRVQSGRPAVDPPANALGLPRNDGLGHPLTYLAWTRSDQLMPHDTVLAVAPFWGWILPLVAPILWWAWCPPGRFVPRRTLRRAMVVTAGIALVLTLLARSSPVDHSVLTLREFDAQITYGPDPGNPERSIPIGVSLDQADASHSVTITPDHAARIGRALGRLPVLRDLALGGTPGPPSIETAMLPPGRPDLEAINLRMSQADAATLARLAEFPNLRRLVLTRSLRLDDASLVPLRRSTSLTDLALGQLRITDAGLEHLHGLTNLRRLDFRPLPYPGLLGKPPNQLTTAALRRLADSLPSLEELTSPDGTVLRPRGVGAGRPGAEGTP